MLRTPLRQPPVVSDSKDPRAREYFEKAVHEHLKMIGERTFDVPSISANGKQTFTITVLGARVDKGQVVLVGLPSGFNTSLLPWGYVSANDTVTVVLVNPTGGAIDPGSATYTARVMP